MHECINGQSQFWYKLNSCLTVFSINLLYAHPYIFVYIYIYISLCVCVFSAHACALFFFYVHIDMYVVALNYILHTVSHMILYIITHDMI